MPLSHAMPFHAVLSSPYVQLICVQSAVFNSLEPHRIRRCPSGFCFALLKRIAHAVRPLPVRDQIGRLELGHVRVQARDLGRERDGQLVLMAQRRQNRLDLVRVVMRELASYLLRQSANSERGCTHLGGGAVGCELLGHGVDASAEVPSSSADARQWSDTHSKGKLARLRALSDELAADLASLRALTMPVYLAWSALLASTRARKLMAVRCVCVRSVRSDVSSWCDELALAWTAIKGQGPRSQCRVHEHRARTMSRSAMR